MEVSLDSHGTETINGNELRQNCRAKLVIPVSRHGTIGCLSKPFCGSRGPAHRGVTCRKNSATGTPSILAFGAGREKACGSAFSRSYRTVLISNTFSSTRHTSGSTSMEPAQKGDSQSGHRQVARRFDHEDCSARRRTRQSGSLRAFVRSTSRRHKLRRPYGRHRLPRLHRRQGIRCKPVTKVFGRPKASRL